MSNPITLSKNEFHELVEHLKRIEKLLAHLVKTQEGNTTMTEEEAAKLYKETYVYEEGEPEYGTDAWWEWAIKQGEEDIKAGRVTKLQSKEDIKQFFDNL